MALHSRFAVSVSALSRKHWGIVQWQDSGFWCRQWGFESLCPSHLPPSASKTLVKFVWSGTIESDAT